ncbi:MAG: hypothetical protein QOJ72_1259 [Nocardioidaceae bacterium]|jgi:hypothetical protein|nr:hypothetical protein [Nocardioidaceae bacterium]
MKRTIRNLIVAAPLATIALTLTPGSAMAFPGPQPPIGIPTPDPHPGPKDKAPKPQPKPPKGPGDLAIPKPKPAQPKPNQPKPAQPTANPGGQQTAHHAPAGTDAKAGNTESAITVPDACLTHDLECNASAPVEEVAAAAPQEETDGMDLTWLLVGGGVVSASGIAFASRKRSRSNA